MKKHVVVTEYITVPEFALTNESRGFVEFLNSKEGAYILNPHQNMSEEFVTVLDSKTGEEHNINLKENVKSIYFGLIGKQIEEYGLVNCMVDQLDQFCNLLEIVKKYEGTHFATVNSIDSIIKNVSKNYLLDNGLTENVSVLQTKKISSVDELLYLSKQKDRIIVKPLISERAHGAIIPSELNEEQLRLYASKYLGTKILGSGLYAKLMAGQGLIVQPYCEGFSKLGEKKVAIVDGEITLARHVLSDKEIVAASNGAEQIKANLTKEEEHFVKSAFNAYKNISPIKFARIDYVLDNGVMKLSEVEAINPSFVTRSNILFSQEDKQKHYARLYDVMNSEYEKLLFNTSLEKAI